MAKKKMMLEEKLEEAIVREIPYDAPEKWVWVKLNGGFAECLDKFRKPVNSTERSKRVGDVPYYGATGQVGFIDDYLTNENLVLVGEDGAPFFDILKDKAYIIDGKAWVNNHAHILKSYYGVIGNKYLMHYLNVFNYNGYVNGTTRLKLTQASMNNIPVPLPPLKEQQRIVDKIESLFGKLDKAKELIEEAREDFEKRKSAILEKAFRGELTKEWRKNKKIIRSEERSRLGDIVEINPKKDKLTDIDDNKECTFVPMPSVSEITGVIEKPLIEKYSKVKKGYTYFKENDIIFAKITPCMENGKSAIATNLIDGFGFGSTEFHVIRCNENVLNRFIYHLVRSKTFRDIASQHMTGAVGQRRVPKSFLGEYEIILPRLEEQKEIVRILDSLLEKESKIDELTVLEEQIELIKKSILAKAFRGQLGTNCEEDESALELLKKILSTE